MHALTQRRRSSLLQLGVLLGAALLAACAHAGNYLAPQEKQLGTDSKLDRSFHVVADEPQGFGLRMTGFVIGIEKSSRDKLDVPPLASDPYLNADPADFNAEVRRRFAARLNDSKRTFISHVVQSKLNDRLAIAYIENEFLYDAYCMACPDGRRPSKPVWTMQRQGLYARSWESLEKLEAAIAEQLAAAHQSGRPFTHVIVATMGWNTAQEKAIRNLNSIFGNILLAGSAISAMDFKPLYIAITWPSEWNVPGVSLANKANDADEIGFVWANALINRHLSGLRGRASNATWPAFNVVAIGHSLGARLVTRAAFSGSALAAPVPLREGADLVIGLQGAFSMNRFLAERESGREGAPYANYKALRGRIALTWSAHDSATPAANFISGANYAGAKAGYKRASDPRYQQHFAFYEADEAGDLTPATQRCDRQKRVTYIDASELIRYEVLGTGGKAHSDIYNAYMGKLLATLIADDCRG